MTRVEGSPRRWMSAYAHMLRFDFASQRAWLPMTVVMQTLMGAGMAIIYGFYMPARSSAATMYLVTGAPALALIPLGIVLLPMLVTQQKQSGTFDFVASLPVPRVVATASTLTVFTAVAVPGIVATLLLSWLRYGVSLDVSWTIVPAFLLTGLMACSLGMALAHAIGNTVVVNLVSNVLIFFVLMYSPIAFPSTNFPGWLAGLHQGLPFQHMATVIRAGLTSGIASGVGTSYAVLCAWTVGSWLVTAWVIGRRR